MTGPKQAVSLCKVDTEYSADCIEWCPFAPFQDVFVCGTYQVLEPTASPAATEATEDEDEAESGPSQTQRTGRLLVYQVQEGRTSTTEIQRIDTPAILDAKWSPRLDSEQRPVLGVADAKGRVSIYALNLTNRILELIQSVSVAEETILCLSLDWSHRFRTDGSPHMVVSLSNGSLALLSTTGDDRYELESPWHAHDFEPWCAAFDHDSRRIWSGGDDLKLKSWSTSETSMPTFVNKRFEAGVTTITASPHTPSLIAVGSYDEHLRLYDTRSPQRPLRTIHLGGGIWRARFHPTRRDQILVACMHDGFKVVKLDPVVINAQEELADATDDDTGCEILTRFDGHESLAYGADWSRLPPTNEGTLIATCSFYDHQMHLWRA